MANYGIKLTAGIHPKTEIIEIPEVNGLEVLQNAVGGWIEYVRIPGGGPLFVVNEEGLLKPELEVNMFPTFVYMELGARTPIKGDIVIGEYDGRGEPRWLELHKAKEIEAMVAEMASSLAIVNHSKGCEHGND